MNTREKLRSDSLNLLRFPLAVFVVTVHVFGTQDAISIKGHEYNIDSFPLFMSVFHFIDGFIHMLSVPIYFFISGYVFFLGITLTKDVYKKKLRNRVQTLLIPFVVWNVIALLLRLIPFYIPSVGASLLNPTTIDYSFSAFLNTFWDRVHGVLPPIEPPIGNAIYPQLYPLWFMRDLMIVVLFTPAIYYLMKRTHHYFIGLLGLTWFILGFWDLGHITQLLTAFFFFSFGAYMSINQKDMLIEFGKHFRLSTICYITLALLYIAAAYWMPEQRGVIKRMEMLFGLLFFYNLASWLLKRGICRPNSFLASASFFIYVAHALVCKYLLKVLLLVSKPSSGLEIVCLYILTILLTVCLLLGVFWLLRRYAPAFLKVIAGRK